MSFPIVVRAFIFNPLGQILLTKHTKDAPWVLPGGHLEDKENIHEAVQREILEEFWIHSHFFEIDSEETLYHKWKKLKNMPLPISIYELNYRSKEGKDKSRIEYVFLMETDETITKTQATEIYEYKWFDADDILIMKPNIEIYDFTLEMLEKIIGNNDENE
jgi:8-oxo-dGTP pyrophosphatase MutT (NUDIX family)